MSGMPIGDCGDVAANSVVVKDVPHHAIVAGNPAKVVGLWFDQSIIDRFLELRWLNLDDSAANRIISVLQRPPSEDVLTPLAEVLCVE